MASMQIRRSSLNLWRRSAALCVLQILLSPMGFCSSTRLWQDREPSSVETEPSSSSRSFAYTSPAITSSSHSARKGHHHHHRRSHAPYVNIAPYSPDFNDTSAGEGTVFNVLAFNAVGDGMTDDTKAFQATWCAACLVRSAVIEVPADHIFVVGPITFRGPCQSNLSFQVDGTIMSPDDLHAWTRLPNKIQWIGFYQQVDMTLQGTGIINGRGNMWWSLPCKAVAHGTKRCASPTAVKFYGCSIVVVRDIMIQDSPQMHLKFDNCQQVQVINVSISSPLWSPNTDGIHLTNTGYALLENLAIAAGDDCISLQTGTTDVIIRYVLCGPGHGISIGGLGFDNTQACVSNITVEDVVIQNTQNGIRIKTWQGGLGTVQHVIFNNVWLDNVQNPIVINQFYCDSKQCQNQSAAVLVSDIYFHNIRGTYDAQHSHAAIYFACSDTIPCHDIVVENVVLVPTVEAFFTPQSYCWNSYGISDPISCSPPVCLNSNMPEIKQSFEYC